MPAKGPQTNTDQSPLGPTEDPLVPKIVPLRPKERPLRQTEGHQVRATQTDRRFCQIEKGCSQVITKSQVKQGPLRLAKGPFRPTSGPPRLTQGPFRPVMAPPDKQGHLRPTGTPIRPAQSPLMPTQGPLMSTEPALLGRNRICSG